jgi:hypothetical protein
MGLKNIKVDYETWRDLAKQKIENNLKRMGDVIRDNNVIGKKFNNEEGFTNWFIDNYRSLGFEKVVEYRKRQFPDFIMLMDNKEVKVELETLSSHFIEHNHDSEETDFVICLVKDKELPVTTIEVSMFEYLMPNKGEIITIRGERELWLDFTHKVKKDKKKLWPVLRPFLRKYVSSDRQQRVLLMLLPKELVEELLDKEDPDEFIQQAIRKHLETE